MKLRLFDFQLTNDINRKYTADFIRSGLIFGLIIYSAFGALDYFLLPENYHLAWIIRFGIMTPFLILFYFLTFREKYLPIFSLVMPILVIFGQLGIVAMIYISNPSEGAFFVYYAGLILVSLWAGMIYRLQTSAAVTISLSGIILYNLVAIFDQHLLSGSIHSEEFGMFLNNNFFLVTTSLLSTIGTYQMNKYHTTIIQKNVELTSERDELEKARQKAEQSDKIKTAFLANISHEIRTPMNAILGFSQLLNDPETKDDEKREFADLILNRGEELLKILTDLLDYSKLVAYDIKLNFEYVEAESFVVEAMRYGNNLLQKKPYPEEKREVIHSKNNKENKTLYTDPHRVNQILEHLINNAVKFSSRGNVELGYYYEEVKEGEYIIFFVKDHGIGIRDDQREVIFDGFRQADESYSRKYDGAGIGLSFSKPMATMLGGKLWFDSIENQGSTFYLSIPVNLNAKSAGAI